MNKVAIIYDWIDKWGGAERILQTIFEAYPKADIYTLYYDKSGAPWANKYENRINTTFLQGWYRAFPYKQFLSPVMPFAVESLNLSSYEAVLSVSSSFAKGVITRPETNHVSYVFTPTRFLWHERGQYNGMEKTIMRPVVRFLKNWDQVAIHRPDSLLTLSTHTQKLFKHVYGVKSEVLPPPFEEEYFSRLKRRAKKPTYKLPSKYFLFVGRLEPYKKIDIAIDAFRKNTKHELVIVGNGSGSLETYMRAFGAKNIHFLSSLSEEELAYVYARATALVMPQSEDFGYTALESLYFGTPVISYSLSGVTEFVRHKHNGYLFQEQTVSALLSALEKFHTLSYNDDRSIFRTHSRSTFLHKLKKQLTL